MIFRKVFLFEVTWLYGGVVFMSMVLELVKVFVALLFISKGADWVVNSAAKIAARLGISELIIGLTFVAFGTSLPEFCVSVIAAIQGLANISVANVVGSNLFNIGIILGICAVVRSIKISKDTVNRDGFFLIGITILLLWIMLKFTITKLEGLVFIALLILYIWVLARQKEEPDSQRERARWLDNVLFLIGLGGVIVGSRILISSATFLARTIGISEWVIGVTLVAIGTSLPELATSLVAAKQGLVGISAGNLIGSSIFNILGVLGVSAVIGKLLIDPSAIYSIIAVLTITCLAILFLRTNWEMSRKEGIVLFIICLAFYLYLIL